MHSLPVGIWQQLLSVEYEECSHTLAKQAEQQLESDGTLLPGINCCAVCASTENTITCDGCQYVKYCGKEHQESDAGVHERVCSTLRMHSNSSEIHVADEEVKPVLSYLLERCVEAHKPLLSWSELVQGDESAAACPRDTGHTPDLCGRMAAAGQPDAPPVPCSEAGAQLAPAASASSYLSGPLTLAHALGTMPELQQLVMSSRASSKPLRIAIIGANEADCAHLEAWKAVGCPLALQLVGCPLALQLVGCPLALQLVGCPLALQLVGCPLALQLVGPDVPDHLHLTTRQLESKVTLAFYMRKFEELVGAMERGWAALPEELQLEPQLLLGLNLGLTCPEYRWGPALAAAERVAKRAGPATPPSPSSAEAASSQAAAQSSAAEGLLVVSTTATQSESYEESALLGGRGWALVSEPARNPFVSLEVQQSGTMANDIYRKSSWLALHRASARKPSKRKSWGEWAVGMVQGLKEMVSPAKRHQPCPSPASAAKSQASSPAAQPCDPTAGQQAATVAAAADAAAFPAKPL